MKRQTTQLCRILTVSLLVVTAPLSAFAAYKTVNNDDKPLMAIQLTNSKGDQKTAKIFIPPKGEMIFGDDGWPASGAGYIEAEEGKTYYVPFMWEGKDGKAAFGGFRVQRIEWDKAGRFVSIKGLQKEFEASSNLEISSDLAKPKIVDGFLFLKFKGRGETEYKFKTIFGKGAPFTNELKGF